MYECEKSERLEKFFLVEGQLSVCPVLLCLRSLRNLCEAILPCTCIRI